MNPQTLAVQLRYLESELRALKQRMAQFEGITGIAPGPTDMVDTTYANYDSGSRMTTLSWLHVTGATYRVEVSTDRVTWNTVTGGENIAAATGGPVITMFTTPALAPSPPPTWYRIRRNPYVCTPAVS